MRMECNSSSGTISFLYKNVGYNFDNYTEGCHILEFQNILHFKKAMNNFSYIHVCKGIFLFYGVIKI